MRLRLPLVVLAALLTFHCMPFGKSGDGQGGGTGGGDGAGGGGGTTGTPGWSLSYPEAERGFPVVSVVFAPPQGNATTEGIPPNDDPWRAAVTTRTFDLVRDSGDAHAEGHLTITIGDPTVTIHITSSASSGGNTVGSAGGGINNATWCYRPPAGHTSVRFTSEFTGSGAPVVGGQNALSYYQFTHVGTDCSKSAASDWGTVSTHADCETTTEDVLVDSDGNACLNGSVDEPQYSFGVAGASASKAGDGSASLDATFKITATPL